MEETLISAGVEMMSSEASENFSDMASVFFFGVGVDEYVVEVHQYTNIKQVAEDVIHEALESGGCVGESKRHNMSFKGAIVSPESCLPFIALSDSDQMVHVSEVDFQIYLALHGLSRRLEMQGRG